MSEKAKEIWEKLSGFKYVLITGIAGLVLLLWPAGGTPAAEKTELTEEARIAAILSQIEGVGQTEVLLSDKGAVIVCRGASDAAVSLHVTQAVRCYTGLGADKVKIFNMQ